MVETQSVRASLDLLSTELLDLTTALNAFRYISGAKVGADLAFLVNTTADGVAVTKTIMKPTHPRDGYQFFIHNPSSVCAVTFELFTVTSSLVAADRDAFLLSFGTTYSVCAPTSYETFRHDIARALFAGGDLKIIMKNDLGFTAYGPVPSTSYTVTVRLVEFI